MAFKSISQYGQQDTISPGQWITNCAPKYISSCGKYFTLKIIFFIALLFIMVLHSFRGEHNIVVLMAFDHERKKSYRAILVKYISALVIVILNVASFGPW